MSTESRIPTLQYDPKCDLARCAITFTEMLLLKPILRKYHHVRWMKPSKLSNDAGFQQSVEQLITKIRTAFSLEQARARDSQVSPEPYLIVIFRLGFGLDCVTAPTLALLQQTLAKREYESATLLCIHDLERPIPASQPIEL